MKVHLAWIVLRAGRRKQSGAAELVAEFDLLTEDSEAHRLEHALEVELPFLQYLKPGFLFQVLDYFGHRRLTEEEFFRRARDMFMLSYRLKYT